MVQFAQAVMKFFLRQFRRSLRKNPVIIYCIKNAGAYAGRLRSVFGIKTITIYPLSAL